ncbi:hypothetical protein FZW96_18050 [Bacillus sp. BGMRC 2118]|nr:hypothetical protein FZW96_18050 [Bacillus sp. BGMRC 2118]
MESKTKRLLAGITAAVVAGSLVGCSDEADRPAPPTDTDCDDWEWDNSDGVWECDDNSSRYYGHYFYGGGFFRNKSALYSSPSYKSYKSSSSFQGGKGFGSGSSFSGS